MTRISTALKPFVLRSSRYATASSSVSWSHPASATKRNGSPFCCSRYFPWVLKWSGHATLEPAAFAAATAATVPAASAPLWYDYFCFLGRCTEAEEYQE